MAINDPTRTNAGPAGQTDAEKAIKRVEHEAEAMHDAARDGLKAVKEGASSLGSQALDEARQRSEQLKDEAATGLHDFADAIRKAAEDLSKKQPGIASDLIGQAASGLEGLSRSLQNRSTGQMIDDIRSFGRSYPGAFIAGSILAGIAIGRFAGSSATHSHSGTGKGSGETSRSSSTGSPYAASSRPSTSSASGGTTGQSAGTSSTARHTTTEASHGKH